MNPISADLHASAARPADVPLWTRPRTLTVRTKADVRTFGYPTVRAASPAAADADPSAEEPERWDGLS